MTAADPAAAQAPAAEGRPWRKASNSLAVLGPFFLSTYGFANWLTSRRASVGSVVFGWERHIPFLAWTIVPYCSIDFLYVLSIFICRTRHELAVHVRRLFAAQLISVFCFLLFPLRFTSERPETSGFFGVLFHLLSGFDRPFNQAPSLHVSLACILCARYDAYLRGAARWAMRGWFALVVISTLTTYQHHFVDVPAGLAVGLLCLALFPERPSCRVPRQRPLAPWARTQESE